MRLLGLHGLAAVHRAPWAGLPIFSERHERVSSRLLHLYDVLAEGVLLAPVLHALLALLNVSFLEGFRIELEDWLDVLHISMKWTDFWLWIEIVWEILRLQDLWALGDFDHDENLGDKAV